MTKNKLQRIAKIKMQIGKFVKNHSSSSSNKSQTFLLVCRNLPGKANLKINNLTVTKELKLILCSISLKYISVTFVEGFTREVNGSEYFSSDKSDCSQIFTMNKWFGKN